MTIVVMGVSGCGKSTTGKALAERIAGRFHDADDYHTPANIQKMSAGQPLDDTDRLPWLKTLNTLLRQAHADNQPLVLACSALKQSYRNLLQKDLKTSIQWVHLKADLDSIHKRMTNRTDHFMPAELLQSQFDALEEPDDAIIIDANLPAEQIVEYIYAAIRN